MKVNRIENNVNFGYNKKLNQELMSNFKNACENKEYIEELSKLVKYTNSLENRLKNSDLSGAFPVTVANLSDMFVSLKGHLCDWLGYLYPDLKYPQREYNSYKAEMKALGISENQNHWMCRITEEIKDFYLPENENDNSIATEFPDDIKEMRAEYQAKNNKNGAFRKMPGAKNVTEYIPTGSALKGFAGLGGMNELKEILNEGLVSILKDPVQAKFDEVEYGISMPEGVLLYGPQGCGKTTIVEALSVEADVPLLEIGSDVTGSAYIHEMSEKITDAFKYAAAYAKAIEKPVIVMIDDADGLLASRNSDTKSWRAEEMATFLKRIQEAYENNVLVIIATNKYDNIDDAIKSRFEEQIYVGLPDKDMRKSLITMFLSKGVRGNDFVQNEDNLNKIADITEGFPTRDIKMICKNVIRRAKKDRRNLEIEDFRDLVTKNEKRKVKEDLFRSNKERKSIGFS